jgi:hypothetical protein
MNSPNANPTDAIARLSKVAAGLPGLMESRGLGARAGAFVAAKLDSVARALAYFQGRAADAATRAAAAQAAAAAQKRAAELKKLADYQSRVGDRTAEWRGDLDGVNRG